MAKPPTTRQLTAFLLREGVSDHADALKDSTGLERYSIRDELGCPGALYVRPQISRQPWWLAFVAPGLDLTPPAQTNAGTAAVLFLDVDGRTLAFTFGRGRYLLREEAYQRDFGLKTTLSAVEPEQLRSVDVRTVDDLTLQKRAQASRGTSFPTFGMDISRDLLSAVTGELPPDSFAKRLTGRDAIAVTAAVEIQDLGELASDLLHEFHSGKYRENFSWVDHLRPVDSRSAKDDLDEELLARLRGRDLELVHMAPPETVDWESIQGFYFSGRKSEESHTYLSIHEYLDHVGDQAALTVEKLKRDRVRVQWANAAGPVSAWSVYHCLVAELRLPDGTYVLSSGDYYQADSSFVDDVDRRLRALDQTTIPFPAHQSDEREDHYNARAAQAISGALLDKKLIRVRPGEHPIEPCDIFTSARQFVHVKRRSVSSTLSHLFAQGTVSAQSFLLMQSFRQEFRELVAESNQPGLAGSVPVAEAPRPRDFTVVYAIVARDSPDWPRSLPFFSRVNLSNAAERLLSQGFQVATQCISRA